VSANWSLRDVFPETEIVDASWLMQKLGVSSLDVSNGARLIGTVTAADIERHAASADPTRLIGSIMTPRPEMMCAPSPRASDDREWQQKRLATGW
jgi:CBS domain-containing protein